MKQSQLFDNFQQKHLAAQLRFYSLARKNKNIFILLTKSEAVQMVSGPFFSSMTSLMELWVDTLQYPELLTAWKHHQPFLEPNEDKISLFHWVKNKYGVVEHLGEFSIWWHDWLS